MMPNRKCWKLLLASSSAFVAALQTARRRRSLSFICSFKAAAGVANRLAWKRFLAPRPAPGWRRRFLFWV